MADNARNTSDTAAKLAGSQAELTGRLAQISESQVAHQSKIAELMQTQEKEVTKKIEERLSEMMKSFGEGMEKSRVTQQNTMGELKERLVLIDAAQKNIEELSSQVVSLQDILSNKQARGAFGEIQLADLVRSIMPPNAYVFQATVAGNRRVDCLLTLPNPPGPIAIDAKFPLESYRTLLDSKDENDKKIGTWNDMEIHYLTGKLLSLIMCDFHEIHEEKWSGFLHASAVSKSSNAFVIVGTVSYTHLTLPTILLV